AGLLALALRPETPSALADRAAGALLAALPREGHTYPRLALRRAAQLLERHADDRARVVLDDLHRARPDVRAVVPWRAALDARRLGRVALAGELPARGRLAPAFWLDGQRPVWLRSAAAPETERLAAEARLQAAPAPGAAAERLLYAPPLTLVLADLDGVEQREPAAAAALHAPLAVALARALVPSAGVGALAPEMAAALARALAEPRALGDLIGVLDRAALRAGHG